MRPLSRPTSVCPADRGRCARQSVCPAVGVKVMSMGFLAQTATAVIWRGPLLHKALEQFLADMDWGQPDFLLVDMPPGTG